MDSDETPRSVYFPERIIIRRRPRRLLERIQTFQEKEEINFSPAGEETPPPAEIHAPPATANRLDTMEGRFRNFAEANEPHLSDIRQSTPLYQDPSYWEQWEMGRNPTRIKKKATDMYRNPPHRREADPTARMLAFLILCDGGQAPDEIFQSFIDTNSENPTKVQLRGTAPPPWFPGYYHPLSDNGDIALAAFPEDVMNAAWKAMP